MTTIASVAIPTGTWNVDPVHSTIGFRVRHFGVSWFRGTFADVTGTIETDDDTITKVAGEIDIPSLRIENPQLTAHLLSGDFFDAENHPRGSFTSRRIERLDAERYRIVGDLELRGVTGELVLDATLEGLGPDINGDTRIGITGTGEIDRTAWGISWNAPLETGGVVVGEKVRLTLEVEAKLAV